MASNPPTQPVFLPGRTLATTLQTVADGVNYLTGQPRSGQPRAPFFYLQQTVAQSIANNSAVGILFDTEIFDTDNGHSTSTNTSRYTFQTSGTYLMTGVVVFGTSGSGDFRKVQFQVNGSTSLQSWPMAVAPTTTVTCSLQVSGPVSVTAGDYIELLGQHNTGGALNTAIVSGGSRLAGYWIGP